ncbi:uncharacterized protein LOC135197743 isoform X2 [Macrobrachium nipponense]|uniref:uncharacterized protein LOC135197743 isoform X2 n=1 Tax=Macrobrachium nipponense TaxID=159736 RepID=UPI0030C7FDAC
MKSLVVVLLSLLVISGSSQEDHDSASQPDTFEQDFLAVGDVIHDAEPEELPVPEAYHSGRRRRLRPTLAFARHRDAPPLRNTEETNHSPPYMNHLYTSSLNDIQQGRLPSPSFSSAVLDVDDESEVFNHHSDGGDTYHLERDAMDTDESFTWLSRLVPGIRSRRPTLRPRSQPYGRFQGRMRGQGRPGKPGGRVRLLTRGRQNLRRPPVYSTRPRTPFSQTAVRPRFRGPVTPHRPPLDRGPPQPSTFPVTEPTTTTPDTLSVHNIAGPPYADTIPPNILFEDDEITTPFEYPSSSVSFAVTPSPASVQPWVPVSSSGTRWTYGSTTPTPVTKSFNELDHHDASNREKEADDVTKWGNAEEDEWGEEESEDDDYIWGSDLHFRWPNSWNHNWGTEWSKKFNTEKTARPDPTPTSGYSTPSGRTQWEGQEYFATSTKAPERQSPEVYHSLDDSYMQDNLPKNEYTSETTTSMRFPEFSTENHRSYDTPSTRNFMFPEAVPTDKPKISDSVGNAITYQEVEPSNTGYDTTPAQELHEYHHVSSNHPRPLPGQQRFPENYGGNRRVLLVPKERQPPMQGYPVRIKAKNTPQYSQGLRARGKGTFGNNRFSESRIAVKAIRPHQPVLRPVFAPEMTRRIWTPGRVRGTSTEYRPRG